MTSDPAKFEHDRSAYERPNLKYRCGRGALWGKPCHNGPNTDGSCGGASECIPLNKGKSYECRRPKAAGGPCPEGPRPDGSCSKQYPPCVPRKTLRAWRGQLAFLSAGISMALVLTSLSILSAHPSPASLVHPGPLSIVHTHFTAEQGCVACHAPHRLNASEWWRALTTQSDFTAECIRCHTFEGSERLAHNTAFPERADLKEAACIQCHTEHKGGRVPHSAVTDLECRRCHQQRFESFEKGHPEFPEGFPHGGMAAVTFDHTKHLSNYFLDSRYADKAPKTCTTCHAVEASGAFHLKAFEHSCASCHGSQISQKDLVLFRLPELDTGLEPVVADAAYGAERAEASSDSGTSDSAPAVPDSEAARETKPFESVSFERPTEIMNFLLDISGDDIKTYTLPVNEWLLAMIKEGRTPFAERLAAREARDRAADLLSGLSAETVREAAYHWGRNREYEPPEETPAGWFADYLELRYKPSRHADPVVRNWIEFSIEAAQKAAGSESAERAAALRDHMLSKDGPGRCAKCHTFSQTQGGSEQEPTVIRWQAVETTQHPQTFFSHATHMRVLSSGQGCITCHSLREPAKPGETVPGVEHAVDQGAPLTEFLPIRRQACVTCHAQEKVRQDCTLCHRYHWKSPAQTEARMKPKAA